MIELPIPAEITKYEAKLAGPFTTRQAVCGGSAAVIAILLWNNLKDAVPNQTLYFGILLIAIPFGVIGWWKPYGMSAEKFILAIMFNTILSPTKRVFSSSNYMEGIEKAAENAKAPDASDKKALKSYQKQQKQALKKRRKAVKNYRKQTFA